MLTICFLYFNIIFHVIGPRIAEHFFGISLDGWWPSQLSKKIAHGEGLSLGKKRNK